jgi:hypothetical protein
VVVVRFDSHVNGSLVMKELKAPWTHWHSSRAKIQDTASKRTIRCEMSHCFVIKQRRIF